MRTIIIIKSISVFLLIVNVSAESVRRTITNSIPLPDGYERIEYSKNTFSYWIQNLPVKKDKRIVIYNRKYIPKDYYNVFAVVQKQLLFKSAGLFFQVCRTFLRGAMGKSAEFSRQNKRLSMRRKALSN